MSNSVGLTVLGQVRGSLAYACVLFSGANRALGLSDELFVLGGSVILTVLGRLRCCCVQSLHGMRVSCRCVLVSGVNRALGPSDELFVLGDSVILTVLGPARHLCTKYNWKEFVIFLAEKCARGPPRPAAGLVGCAVRSF